MKRSFSLCFLAVLVGLSGNAPAQSYSFSTIAGTAGMSGTANGTNDSARLSFPTGMAVDTNGDVYFADRSSNHAIRRMVRSGTNWVVTTIAGGSSFGFVDGTNTSARFFSPGGVAFDQAGNLYVADVSNHSIRRMIRDGTNWIVTTIAGGGTVPFGVPGNPGSSDGTNRNSGFYQPVRLVVDAATNIYVADYLNYAIRKVAPDGTNWTTTTIAGLKQSPGTADGTNNEARFRSPNGTALDSSGNLYVSDGFNGGSDGTIRKLTPEGTNWIVTTIATGLATPACVAIDSFDNIFVAEVFAHRIKRLTLVGTNWIVTSVGGNGVSGSSDGIGNMAQFNRPDGVAVDKSGNLFVGDSVNRTMRLGIAFPVLQLAINSDQATLSWGEWPTNFFLESTGGISSSNSWISVNAPVETTNGQNIVVLPKENGDRFFRLKQF